MILNERFLHEIKDLDSLHNESIFKITKIIKI